MKTNELTGAALNWAVAISNDLTVDAWLNRQIIVEYPDGSGYYAYEPAFNWAHGGPIIEKEKLYISPEIGKEGAGNAWYAVALSSHDAYGQTPLIAAMRCYVASKLGDDVNIPRELL